MTQYYYSASENAFIPVLLEEQYVESGTFPDDAREIDNDVADVYMGPPPHGKVRTAGNDGMPEWSDIPPLTDEEQVAAANTKKQELIEQANEYMSSKQWPGKAVLGRLSDTEKAQYSAWLDYLDALEAVGIPSSGPDIDWPEPPED